MICPGCGQCIAIILVEGQEVFVTHQAVPANGSGDACEYSGRPARQDPFPD